MSSFQSAGRRIQPRPHLAFIFSWILCAMSSALLLAQPEQSPDRILTLEDSVRLATNNSQVLLMSHEDVDIALQRVKESQSLFFPTLDLNANWSKFGVEGDAPLLLQPALGPTLIPASPRENFYTTRANIYQTIYQGGRVRDTWRQARISYERAKVINEALATQVTSMAKQAFFDLLLAQEKSRQYAQVLDALKPAMARADSLGLSERLRFESEVSALRADAGEASLAEQEALLAYLRTLNLELNTKVLLKGQLETHPMEIDLQKMLAWSTQYRSELRQTEYQQELDALGVSLTLAERTPTVALGASYERTGNDIALPVVNWAGTLNVNLPVSISDMFYGRSKVREHRAQYRQATLKHAETADQIQMQVREAYTKYRFWQDELHPRELAYQHMRDMVRAVRERSRNVFERIQAERLLLEAYFRYQEAVHGHLTAIAALERAVGHPITGES